MTNLLIGGLLLILGLVLLGVLAWVFIAVATYLCTYMKIAATVTAVKDGQEKKGISSNGKRTSEELGSRECS